MGVHQPPPQPRSSRIGQLASRVPTTLGVVASLIAIGGLGFGIFKALSDSGDDASAAVEAKQIIAFRQVTNRICAENHDALLRALPEAHSGVQLLSFLARGTGWGINDLEGVTAPKSMSARFAEEIQVRRQVQEALLEVQRAGETGDRAARTEAASAVDSAEGVATEVNRELGLRKCAPVLAPNVRRAIDVS